MLGVLTLLGLYQDDLFLLKHDIIVFCGLYKYYTILTLYEVMTHWIIVINIQSLWIWTDLSYYMYIIAHDIIYHDDDIIIINAYLVQIRYVW